MDSKVYRGAVRVILQWLGQNGPEGLRQLRSYLLVATGEKISVGSLNTNHCTSLVLLLEGL
jgi:hypothetical protein